MAVCDGLSSAQLAHEASAQAAQCLVDTLSSKVARSFDPVKCMNDAIMKAHAAVCTIKYKESESKGPPGATIVAAILSGTTAIIGWVGDSRAYVASSFGAKLLTRDHTWINEVVDSGRMTAEEAVELVNPHVLTKCIGPMEIDSSGEPPAPSIVSVQLPPLSWLVLCSDGFWNYDEKLSEFDEVVKDSSERACALTFARKLVAFANARGGRDNITVAVACTS
jgi:serine/threonine protein phosphatase PrpC